MAGIYPITLPKWGLEMAEGTVAAWHLDAGAKAEKGADLVDIETDKIVNTVELDVSGTLARVLVPAGDVAAVGALIAVVADADVAEADIDAFIAAFKPVDAGFEPDAGADKPEQPAPVQAEKVNATPLARRIAQDQGVPLADVTGTGKKGRITRDDVVAAGGAKPARLSPEEAAARNAALHVSPVAGKFANAIGLDLTGIAGSGRKGRVSLEDARSAAERAGLGTFQPVSVRRDTHAPGAAGKTSTEQPFGPMRRAIARSVSASKQTVPHFYTSMPIRIDALTRLRRDMNAANDGSKLSVNDFFLRAAALALHQCPDVNVHVSDDGITAMDSADICVAVAVDGGLLAPVLRDVGAKGVRTIARESAELIAAARARSLASEALQGGSFTLSNLGMFGVSSFDAIITPPQGAILALGGAQPVATRDADGGIVFRDTVTATLSADHRAIDGAMAAGFLQALRDLIEQPFLLLN